MPEQRRFPPPWSDEKASASFEYGPIAFWKMFFRFVDYPILCLNLGFEISDICRKPYGGVAHTRHVPSLRCRGPPVEAIFEGMLGPAAPAQKKGTGHHGRSLQLSALAFRNNRRRRWGFALADSVGLCGGRDGKESQRRCRQ